MSHLVRVVNLDKKAEEFFIQGEENNPTTSDHEAATDPKGRTPSQILAVG